MPALASDAHIPLTPFDYAVSLLNESAAKDVTWKVVGRPGRRRGLLLAIPRLSLQPWLSRALVTFCAASRKPKHPPARRADDEHDVIEFASTPTDVFRFFGRIGALRAGTKWPSDME